MKLNGGLHGNVHGLVGDGMNMGSVPWAANDPIFWLHHCNIDRLWASWNAAGRSNPAGSGSFTFAEKKKKVVANIHDWMDPKTEKHGYCYDKLESVPKCATTKPAVVAKIQSSLKVAAMKEKEIKLGAAPVKVPLGLLTVKKNEKPLAFHERIKALPNNKHVYLIVKNLHADATPGVLYHLYLELPEGVKGDKALPHYVGTVNFFDAVKHGDAGHEMKKGPGMFFRFDITDVARGLHAKNLLQASPTLTIAPAGQPADKANAVIGEISIVEE
jgi:tyrosinase